ncbi:MAG: magnesium transporter CorA family protein [Thaumarchaeota archaeon]|nr:magnesium transporter CorA family protein [Nitrososphaerota archaeon]
MEVEGKVTGSLDEVRYKHVRWINIVKPTENETEILGKEFGFHKLDLDDCLSKIQLTKIDEYADYLFFVIHYPISINEGNEYASRQLSVFLGKDYLITLHQGDLKLLAERFHLCKTDENQRQALMSKSSIHLFYHLIDGLVDGLLPILNKLMGDLEAVEDEVFDERIEAVRKLTTLRRQTLTLRRIITPYRRFIDELQSKAYRFSAEDLSPYFDNVKDHIEKALEMLATVSETVEIFKDTELTLNTERTNRVLSVLTVLFTLSIPATVIGTLYGMNVNLPGGIETGSLSFLGPYTTFIVLLFVSLVAALSLALYFHRLGWL